MREEKGKEEREGTHLALVRLNLRLSLNVLLEVLERLANSRIDGLDASDGEREVLLENETHEGATKTNVDDTRVHHSCEWTGRSATEAKE
jgi:hypothetical protein